MKKVLKFAPLCALLLAVVVFILMMAGHSVVYTSDAARNWYSGVSAIFGGGTAQITISGFGISLSSGVQEVDAKLAWNALLAWIFVVAALVLLLISSVTVFVKIKPLEKFGGLIALISAGLLLVAGIFLFFTVPAFAGANEWNNADGWGLGAAWVIGAILAIVAGAVSAFPAVLALVEKK